MEFAHKNIRLRPESYRGTRLIFITLCCEAKKSVFADGERAWWLIDCVRKEAQASRFAVHAFCVMPDHFHALVQGLDRSSDLWERVAWYIWMNPVRKGLCAHAQDYPFSGSFTMDWKGAARSDPR